MKKRLNYLVGGHAGNGGNAGLLYLNCNNGLGNSNWNIAAREYDSFLFMVIQRCCIQAAASGTGVRSLVRKISNVCKSAVKAGGMGLSRVGVSSGTKAL